MASGDTLAVFRPGDNEPPSANYAIQDLRNAHPILVFDQTTQKSAIFTGVLPRHYGGSGVTTYLCWSAVPTTGNVGWDVAFERIGDGQQDIDADGFATAQTVTAAAVPGTSGLTKVTNVACSNGANIDSIAVGETFRVRIRRDVGVGSNAAGNAELLSVELKET